MYQVRGLISCVKSFMKFIEVIMKTLRERVRCDPHFTDETNEVQGGQIN